MSSVLQVVVFALGIGSTVAHAESLVTAVQQICSNAQQQLNSHDPAAESRGLQGALLQTTFEPLQRQLSQDVNSLQRLSLRDAFWSKAVR